MDADTQKAQAAAKAIEYVKEGMLLGLGTGSTAAHFVRQLGEKVANGFKVAGVPTSIATETLAKEVGVPLLNIDEVTTLDLVVDGADEADGALNLIKGGGAALLREKVIAHASKHMIVIADESKLVNTLGTFALPIEIIQFATSITIHEIKNCLKTCGVKGDEVAIRQKDGAPLITDNGNFILDCKCIEIPNPELLCFELNKIPGVVENGIFPNFKNAKRTLVLGTPNGAKVVE
ncbi:ribose-5-phosphate isomerase RpiA [Pseudaquidulcibacter saccharophilus]|uniref:ribose-5-phosphate isomerase RpiA n=1 Tax=Pseudaquidulcibacter saccharophilus TaxID=2831900 RepID=UPI001EFF3C5B|nr:ribose-5-phosphate isomerase RpiA [Pseudaquidulcibacter saccharophilus]